MRYCMLFIISGVVLFYSCNVKVKTNDEKETAKTEIATAEKDFAKMVAEKGMAEGFWFFADSNAVIKRQNDTLIKGRNNIRNYYSADFYKTATVSWSADFIDASGDIGYSYGKYTWTVKDSTGTAQEYKGVFHSIWKKQENGSWRYVWDD